MPARKKVPKSKRISKKKSVRSKVVKLRLSKAQRATLEKALGVKLANRARGFKVKVVKGYALSDLMVN